jgi:hypothetical protein
MKTMSSPFDTSSAGSTERRDNRFESLESAHDYVAALREVVEEAYSSIEDDTAAERATPGAERRVEALCLVELKLNQLRQHLLASLILLNDLRTLRRLLSRGRQGVVNNPTDAP